MSLLDFSPRIPLGTFSILLPYKNTRDNAEKFEMFSGMYMCICQSYDKSPHTHRKTKNIMWQHKNSTKNLDYTTIADRAVQNVLLFVRLISERYGIFCVKVSNIATTFVVKRCKYKYWIAFCRCSRLSWIASERIANFYLLFFPKQYIHMAR